MVKATSFAGMRCPIAGTLEAIGDKWALLLIRDLLFAPRRYDELREGLGIPPATLAARLRHLESGGILERVRYQERPPRDEYRLTVKGHDLWKVSMALREWGDRWDASGTGSSPVEVVDRENGHPLVLGVIDATTGAAVPRQRMLLRPTASSDAHVMRMLHPSRGGRS